MVNTPSEALAATEKIMRHLTPIILRFVLGAAVLLMAAGVTRALMHPQLAAATNALAHAPLSIAHTAAGLRAGDPSAMATFGLMLLALIPLIRVSFCFVLFLRQRSALYAVFTAYVLAGLTIGILLGRIG
jgi:uncharacterized membrane protein